MSWKSKLENIKFTIKTGNGKEFKPLLIIGESSMDFNTNTYNFIDVEKSLVERKKAQSTKYPLKFYFQGDDNIEQTEEFLQSAKDNRYWTVTHPFYGTIKGQPISISRNDSSYNSTELNVDFWESIVFDFPKSNLSIQDNTLVRKENVNATAVQSYSSKSVQQSADIQKNKESNLLVAKSFETLQTDETNVDYQNALAKAQKSNDNLLKNPNEAILDAQALLNIPSDYVASIKAKLQSYVTAFNSLLKAPQTVADKLFFESQGASCLACLCNAMVNYQFGVDYVVVSEVENVSSSILSLYNAYQSQVESSATSNYTIENSYQANALLQSELYDLVMFTVSNLYNLSFEAQQERIVYLEKDSNLIVLTHKYFGLANDENIETFRQINDIKLKENFRLRKGRKIIYYV